MRTLMIVDDEEGPRQALEMLFKDDYSIAQADSGFQAIKLAQEKTVDVAIVDLRMPRMSGIETLSQLKHRDPAMEVIVLTAYETLETAREALRLGACDYLNKPYELATIRESVERAMQRRSQSEKIQGFHQKLIQLQEEIQNQTLREEMTRTRGDIYASIIHDINGPLTTIYGIVEMINQSIRNAFIVDGDALDALKERLYRVTLQINNCVNVSRRYLKFLREGPNEDASVRVNQTLSDLRDLLRTHPGAKTHELIIHPLLVEISARINGIDLLQILLNLAINAFQCSDSPHRVEIGGFSLTTSIDLTSWKDGPQDRFINVESFANSPPLVSLSIRDTGPGIPPETLAKMFNPYFTTKPIDQGTGLGLSIVKRLVEQAKGAIQVRTFAGQGTDFTVYLPAW